jgi:hypothetical protein
MVQSMNPPSPVLTGVLIIAAGGSDDGFKTEEAAPRPGCDDVDHPPAPTDLLAASNRGTRWFLTATALTRPLGIRASRADR